MAKIRGLNEKAAAGDSTSGTESTEDEPQDSEEPPAAPA